MPRGIPTTKPLDEQSRKLTITLRPEHHEALAQLAGEQYRTVELQAAWLLAKVLSEAGRVTAATETTNGHAAAILSRARARAGDNGDD